MRAASFYFWFLGPEVGLFREAEEEGEKLRVKNEDAVGRLNAVRPSIHPFLTPNFLPFVFGIRGEW
jgi:hypothetical protein